MITANQFISESVNLVDTAAICRQFCGKPLVEKNVQVKEKDLEYNIHIGSVQSVSQRTEKDTHYSCTGGELAITHTVKKRIRSGQGGEKKKVRVKKVRMRSAQGGQKKVRKGKPGQEGQKKRVRRKGQPKKVRTKRS